MDGTQSLHHLTSAYRFDPPQRYKIPFVYFMLNFGIVELFSPLSLLKYNRTLLGFFSSRLFANTLLLFQLCSSFLTANPQTFQGNLKSTPAQYNKRRITVGKLIYLQTERLLDFKLLNQTSLVTVETAKEVFFPPPYSFCPTFIQGMNLPIQFPYLNAPANRIISFIGIAD